MSSLKKQIVLMFPPTTTSFPFLLKLAAAAVTGAAALFAFRRLHRDEAVSSLRRDVLDALLLLRRRDASSSSSSSAVSAPPPTVLVTGFRGHGKSSFINTACRALSGETGPLLLRAETAPPGPGGHTLGRRVVRAMAKASPVEGDEDDDDDAAPAMEFVDGPSLPEPTKVTKAEVEAALADDNGAAPAPECVVIVLRAGGHPKEQHLAVRKLTDVAGAVRDRGLHLVVVVTHKKGVKGMRQSAELRREIAFRARTDCVYFVENYTAGSMLDVRRPPAIKNDFETNLTALTVVRQCVEFAKSHRSHSAARKAAAGSAGRSNSIKHSTSTVKE